MPPSKKFDSHARLSVRLMDDETTDRDLDLKFAQFLPERLPLTDTDTHEFRVPLLGGHKQIEAVIGEHRVLFTFDVPLVDDKPEPQPIAHRKSGMR